MSMHQLRRCPRCAADIARYGETLIDRVTGLHLDVDKIERKTELNLADIATDDQIEEVEMRTQIALVEGRGELNVSYHDLGSGAELAPRPHEEGADEADGAHGKLRREG